MHSVLFDFFFSKEQNPQRLISGQYGNFSQPVSLSL